MTTTTFAAPILSRRASYVPGDTLREMTAPAIDIDGRAWPVGTKYRPFSAGRDNVLGADVVRVRTVQQWEGY